MAVRVRVTWLASPTVSTKKRQTLTSLRIKKTLLISRIPEGTFYSLSIRKTPRCIYMKRRTAAKMVWAVFSPVSKGFKYWPRDGILE